MAAESERAQQAREQVWAKWEELERRLTSANTKLTWAGRAPLQNHLPDGFPPEAHEAYLARMRELYVDMQETQKYLAELVKKTAAYIDWVNKGGGNDG